MQQSASTPQIEQTLKLAHATTSDNLAILITEGVVQKAGKLVTRKRGREPNYIV